MIHSFEEAQRINEANGGKFFQEGQLAWRSANLIRVAPTKGGAFFGMSTRKGRQPREYAVLFVSEKTGKVITWVEPGHYKTASATTARANKEADKGFFGKLFSSSKPDVKPTQYQIAVRSEGNQSTVAVLTSAGQPETSENAQRIVRVIADDLK